MSDNLPDLGYPSRGFGDTVHKFIKKTGMDKITKKKGCKSCKKRREYFNDIIPYKDK